MQILSLVWGVIAFLGMLVAFIPCFGALNWLVIPFAAFGALISILALAASRTANTAAATAGLVCNGIAVIIGTLRLFLGGGIL